MYIVRRGTRSVRLANKRVASNGKMSRVSGDCRV